MITQIFTHQIRANITLFTIQSLQQNTDVAINDVKSASGVITNAVPQGSVLGPALFIHFTSRCSTACLRLKIDILKSVFCMLERTKKVIKPNFHADISMNNRKWAIF